MQDPRDDDSPDAPHDSGSGADPGAARGGRDPDAPRRPDESGSGASGAWMEVDDPDPELTAFAGEGATARTTPDGDESGVVVPRRGIGADEDAFLFGAAPSRDSDPAPRHPRLAVLAALLVLIAAPTALLWPALTGGEVYTPWSMAAQPPANVNATDEQLQALEHMANRDATEAVIWFPSELAVAREAVRGDRDFPHWNPYVRGGAPLFANGHLGLAHPVQGPLLLFSDRPETAFVWLAWGYFVLAGVLTFGLLRSLGLGVLASLFGGLVFQMGGTMAANGHWYMRMAPLAWLPGLLWAARATANRNGMRRLLPLAGFAIGVALVWLAGFPPFAVPVTALTAGACLLLVFRQLGRGGPGDSLVLLLQLALAGILGLGLAAAQLLPMAEFYPVSNRDPSPALQDVGGLAFEPMGLLGLLFTDLFSHPTDTNLPPSASPLVFLLSSLREWQPGGGLGGRVESNYNFTEYAIHIGILPLLFALVGVFGRGVRRGWPWLLGLAVVLLLAIAPGPVRGLYELPGVGAVPPYRWIGTASLFLAVLAAVGLDRVHRAHTSAWRGDGPGAGRKAVLVVAAAAAVGCLGLWLALHLDKVPQASEEGMAQLLADRYAADVPGLTPEIVTDRYLTGPGGESRVGHAVYRLKQNLLWTGGLLALGTALLVLLRRRQDGTRRWPVLLAGGVLLVTAAELAHVAWPLNRTRPAAEPRDDLFLPYLEGQADAARDEGGFGIARVAGPRGGGAPVFLDPTSLVEAGIRDLQGYTFVDGRSSAPFADLYGPDWLIRDYMIAALPADSTLALPFYDALGIRYLFTADDLPVGEGLRVARLQPGRDGRLWRLYERETVQPRARVVPRVRGFADDSALRAALIAPGFAPGRELLRLSPESDPIPARPPEVEAAVAARTVEWLEDRPKQIRLAVGAGPAGYLVLADTHLPGWRAWIDGRPAEIVRCNGHQRAVRLGDRACTVTFRYFTPGLAQGLKLSVVSVLLLVGLLVAGLWFAGPGSARGASGGSAR